MRLLPPRLAIPVIATFFCFPAFAHAQTVQLQPDGSLAFLFTKPLNAVVAFEKSDNLRSWSPATSSEQIVSQGPKFEVHQSIIPFPPDTARVFVRMRVANGWKVALTWAPSPSPDVVGYCLYYGAAPGRYTFNLDVGNRINAIASLPVATKTCYFVVTAYTAIGLQSPPTREVKVRARTKRKGEGTPSR